ncbi:MAG: tol-pal system-associated acyl-CoA thioesterase [Geminicoccaceae bacterium]
MTGADELEVRIYYEDTDAGGIVYHASYLRFAERGRTELLRGLGFDQHALARDQGILFAVSRCDMAFLRPARLDELLVVRTRVLSMSGARIQMAQQIERDGVPLVHLGVTLAVLHAAAMRPVRLPEPLRAAFAQMQ